MPTKNNTGHNAPGGLVGAWFNVIVCTGIVVGGAIYALAQGLTEVDALIAGAVVVIGVGLDIYFIRALLSQRRRSRR